MSQVQQEKFMNLGFFSRIKGEDAETLKVKEMSSIVHDQFKGMVRETLRWPCSAAVKNEVARLVGETVERGKVVKDETKIEVMKKLLRLGGNKLELLRVKGRGNYFYFFVVVKVGFTSTEGKCLSPQAEGPLKAGHIVLVATRDGSFVAMDSPVFATILEEPSGPGKKVLNGAFKPHHWQTSSGEKIQSRLGLDDKAMGPEIYKAMLAQGLLMQSMTWARLALELKHLMPAFALLAKRSETYKKPKGYSPKRVRCSPEKEEESSEGEKKKARTSPSSNPRKTRQMQPDREKLEKLGKKLEKKRRHHWKKSEMTKEERLEAAVNKAMKKRARNPEEGDGRLKLALMKQEAWLKRQQLEQQ